MANSSRVDMVVHVVMIFLSYMYMYAMLIYVHVNIMHAGYHCTPALRVHNVRGRSIWANLLPVLHVYIDAHFPGLLLFHFITVKILISFGSFHTFVKML